MPLTEILYFIAFAVLIVATFVRIPGRIYVLLFAAALLLLSLVGWRWQMLPATIGLALLAALGRQSLSPWIKTPACIFACAFALVSVFFSHQFPLTRLPAPDGPYAVGTTYISLKDPDRAERFYPSRKREIGVQVWYPAVNNEGKRQTLLHEAYSQPSFDTMKALFNYLSHVETHSVIDADVATDQRLPIIIFNPGLYLPADSNILLMEHLASHGYAVFSIAHTYETLNAILSDGPAEFEYRYPADVGFTSEEVSDGGIGDRISQITGRNHSHLIEKLYSVMDQFIVAPEEERWRLVDDAIASGEIDELQPALNRQNLYNFFRIRSGVRNASMETHVADQQLLLEQLDDVFPMPGLLDVNNVGVIGFSYGGSAAGEFCKVDARCTAGINLDGTQFGKHWNQPVPAPFMMIYSDTSPNGNDYAYHPVAAKFQEVHIPTSGHADFADAGVAFPALKTFDLATGSIQIKDMTRIVNDLVLGFFDQELKDQSGAFEDAAREQARYIALETFDP